MESLIIAAAQSCSVAGNIPANIATHLTFMRQAARQGVQFLLFPELSLTGYEPELARECAQTLDAALLQPLREEARRSGVTTIAGLPLRQADSDRIYIAALIFGADGSQRLYTKQHLHAGEDRVFSPGSGGELVSLGNEKVAMAVCADFSHPQHAQRAAAAGASLYAASVLIGESGYPLDSAQLQGYATQHGLPVLMANHGGPTGGWQSAGNSAFWAAGGERVGACLGAGNQLLVARCEAGAWTAVAQRIETHLS